MKRALSNELISTPLGGGYSAFDSYTQAEKRPRVRRVSFTEQESSSSDDAHNSAPETPALHKEVNGAPPLFDTLTEDDCRRLWFQRDELMAAKERMRHMIRFGTVEMYGPEEMSGLSRYSLERSQHKRSAIYYTIAAHQHNPRDHDFVRAVSKRCTGWARHVAAEQAFETYCEVYGDPLESLAASDDWEDDLRKFTDSLVQDGDLPMVYLTPSAPVEGTEEENLMAQRNIPSVSPPPTITATNE